MNPRPLRSLPVTVPLSPTQPGLFTLDGTLAVAQHADFSLVTAERPAAPGEVVTLYAAGLGPVDGVFLSDGDPAPPSPLATTLIRVAVTIGGRPAETLFAGLAPGAVGLYQINVRVPSGLPPGEVEVTVQAGSALSCVARLPLGGS